MDEQTLKSYGFAYRKQILKDNCDVIEDGKITVPFNEGDLAEKQRQVVNDTVEINRLEEEKKDVVKRYNDKIKELKENRNMVSNEVQSGSKTEQGQLYGFRDDEEQKVKFFSEHGDEVYSRPMTTEEINNPTIFQSIRMEGSND